MNSACAGCRVKSTVSSGEVVEVKSEDEILATLDENGTVDGLPFMPEMRKYCGKRFQISARVHKTCMEGTGMGAFKDVVFLEGLECDGAAHHGCGRRCLIFWKECWLRKPVGVNQPGAAANPNVSWELIEKLATRTEPAFCQSTELAQSATLISAWEPRQYLEDVQCGTNGPREFLKSFFVLVYNKVAVHMGKAEWDFVAGQASKTPEHSLNLQPGELVKVRQWREIEAILDSRGRTRGLRFTREMRRFCGGTYRVANRIDRMILEKSGLVRNVKDTVILEQVQCDGVTRRLCPRKAYFYWREAWLERCSVS